MIYADQKILTEPLNQSEKMKLTAVCSGSRGNGKTWLAATICHGFALKKKKILFFDADCALENVYYQLGLDFSQPYQKILNGSLTLNNAAQTFNNGRFDVICSAPGENSFSSAPLGRVQILAKDLSHLSHTYDSVFIDCSDDATKAVNIFLNMCQTIILVVNPDPLALTKAYEKIAHLKKISPGASIKIIINHAQSYEEGRQIYKSLLKASEDYIKLSVDLLGIIRQDPHIRECVLNKDLILKRFPACKGSEDSAAIIKTLLKEQFNEF